MLLSIIIPVYNVAPYIEKCLASLLCQGLSPSDYELIVVNDGSTDESYTIAKTFLEHQASFSPFTFHLISQPNGGLSAARNTGIRHAKGKYIQFVDSDDYLEPNVLGTLVQKMEQEQLDVLRFNYQNVNEQYQVFEPYKTMKPFVDYRDEVCDGLTFLTERLGYGCYAVQFMIRATLLQAEAHHFKAGIYFEDTEWTPRLLVRAQRVTSVDTMVYNYLMRTGSITQSVNPEKTKKLLNDKLLLIDSMKQQAEQQPDKRWFNGMIAATVISLLGYVGADFYPHRAFYFKALREKSIYPLSTYHSSKGAKRKIRVINLSPALFCWLLHINVKR